MKIQLHASTTPIIIWTLQRTGGTNLTTKLTEWANLANTRHEPFNRGRIYWSITEHWIKTRDPEALNAAIQKVVEAKQVIKYCVETVPWKITEALILSSVEAGYRHVFLYRRNALDRLLSLHFAKTTGIWSADMKAMKEIAPEADESINITHVSDTLSEHQLPVEKLITHERRCIGLLSEAWLLLSSLGDKPVKLAYEDLYCGSDIQKQAIALGPIIETLGLGMDKAALVAFATDVVGKGDQGTKSLYTEFPGYLALAKGCENLQGFSQKIQALK